MAIVPAEGWTMPDGVIPDAITPRVGWRTWVWTGSELVSPLFRGNVWHPGRAMEATCSELARVMYAAQKTGRLSKVAARGSHQVPGRACQCGIYAVTDLGRSRAEQLLAAHVGSQFPVIGRVALWGLVQEHGSGYRAQYAYPQAFYVPLRDLKRARKKLAAFGVPVMDMESANLRIPGELSFDRPVWPSRLFGVVMGASVMLFLLEVVALAVRIYLQGGAK